MPPTHLEGGLGSHWQPLLQSPRKGVDQMPSTTFYPLHIPLVPGAEQGYKEEANDIP